MRDIHCHILPGVDDGAANLEQSLAMLEAARAVGVTHMVCTPHCRDPYFDFEKNVGGLSTALRACGRYAFADGL